MFELGSSSHRIFVACFMLATIAQAQDEATLIEEGLALREAGDDAHALERFRAAHDLTQSARSLAQMALAEQALGHWLDAHEHLSAALAEPDDWVEARREPLQSALATTESHLGRLELTGGVAGATVRIDGREVGRMPLSAPVFAPIGTVVLEVRAQGYFDLRRQLTIVGQSLARETIELQANGQPAASSSGASISPVGPIVLAVSGALLIAGVITGAMTLDHDSQLANLCPDNNCQPQARGVLDERRMLGATTDVLMIGSLASAVTGLLLTLFLHDAAPPPLQAGCAHDGCGLTVQGAWQ